MSRVTAPREKTSEASGSVWCDSHVWTTAALELVPDNPARFVIVEALFEEDPEELEDVIEGVYSIGRLTEDMTRLRGLPLLDPEEDEEAVKEIRDPGKPTRMAVLWETIDSARGLIDS
jgi:hypothetical protein